MLKWRLNKKKSMTNYLATPLLPPLSRPLLAIPPTFPPTPSIILPSPAPLRPPAPTASQQLNKRIKLLSFLISGICHLIQLIQTLFYKTLALFHKKENLPPKQNLSPKENLSSRTEEIKQEMNTFLCWKQEDNWTDWLELPFDTQGQRQALDNVNAACHRSIQRASRDILTNLPFILRQATHAPDDYVLYFVGETKVEQKRVKVQESGLKVQDEQGEAIYLHFDAVKTHFKLGRPLTHQDFIDNYNLATCAENQRILSKLTIEKTLISTDSHWYKKLSPPCPTKALRNQCLRYLNQLPTNPCQRPFILRKSVRDPEHYILTYQGMKGRVIEFTLGEEGTLQTSNSISYRNFDELKATYHLGQAILLQDFHPVLKSK
jgi:hypothetical protein